MFSTTKLALFALAAITLTCSTIVHASHDQVNITLDASANSTIGDHKDRTSTGDSAGVVGNNTTDEYKKGDTSARAGLVASTLDKLVLETIAAVKNDIDATFTELVNKTIAGHKDDISTRAFEISAEASASGTNTTGGRKD